MTLFGSVWFSFVDGSKAAPDNSSVARVGKRSLWSMYHVGITTGYGIHPNFVVQFVPKVVGDCNNVVPFSGFVMVFLLGTTTCYPTRNYIGVI